MRRDERRSPWLRFSYKKKDLVLEEEEDLCSSMGGECLQRHEKSSVTPVRLQTSVWRNRKLQRSTLRLTRCITAPHCWPSPGRQRGVTCPLPQHAAIY